MRATLRSPAFLLGVTLMFPATAWADPNVTEGNWEVTTKMEMTGMPILPPQKANQCVTKSKLVPEAGPPDPGQKCTMLDQKVSGDTVSWRMQCKSPRGTMDGEGRITYSGKTFDGTMAAKITDPGGQATNMKMVFAGRHTGACKADPTKAKKPGDY